MTVGLPGSGIGGVFYLLSALAMPFDAAARVAASRLGIRPPLDRQPQWNLVWRQFAIAVGIIAGLWTAGWALAGLLVSHPSALGQAETTAIGRKLPNILRAGAILVSLGTLAGVLITVQIARLVVTSGEKRRIAEGSSTLKIAASLLFLILVPRAAAQTADSAKLAVVSHLQLADRAFDDEDTATARREYQAALAENPGASKALYRLGLLSRRNLPLAEKYFRRYAGDEPGDAWGWIALGDVLAAQKKYRAAIDAYDHAQAIAPAEREVVNGRARIQAAAGRVAPAVELITSGSRDSEENQSMRVGGTASIQAGDRTRLNLSGGKRWLSGFSDVTVEDGSIGLASRPLPAFRLEIGGGVARPHSTITATDTIPGSGPGTQVCTTTGSGRGNGKNRTTTCTAVPPPGTIIQTQSESSASVFVGSVRGVLKKPGARSLLDLRATRSLLDATPVLVINRVVRSEFAGRADVEMIPRLKLRLGGRAGSYNATGDDNTRVSLLGGLAYAATNAVEVSGVFQRLSFSHATTSGYFAPQVAQLAELGSYAEFESDNGTVLALDLGAGAQRLQEFTKVMGDWEPSYRLFASLDVPFRPGSAMHLELDSYDSRLGSDAPSSTSSWRSISLSASLRLALH